MIKNKMKEFSLGIDTSNYKTSVALVDKEGNIIFDERIFLTVKEGELGLRQQEALFQHINNLPALIEGAIAASEGGSITTVSASTRPRPIDGSYMPCFLAGENICKILAASLGASSYSFSHQEGHMMSALRFTELYRKENYIFFHFSGGTTEILKVEDGNINILGQTKDISFGQLLDRAGNKMGYEFPSGKKIDELALAFVPDEKYINELPVIKTKNLEFNLSGIETSVMKHIGIKDNEEIAYMLMERIADCIIKIICDANKDFSEERFLFSGGVSSSEFINSRVLNHFNNKDSGIEVYFASPELSSDNAVGIALLGGEQFWQQNR